MSETVEAATRARAERDGRLAGLDFDRAPFVIAWELTRACAYACAHCRADAQPRRDSGELSTVQALELVDELAGFGNRPILVLTGGDPLMRRDVFEIAAHANRRGLRVALTPTATALTTPTRLVEARSVGVRRVAFSLDAPVSRPHDRFRGFHGSFKRTLAAIEAAAEAGLPLQVNTTVCAQNAASLKYMVPMIAGLGAVQWSVFFLVPTGRGRRLGMLSADGHERLIRWLDGAAAELPFDVKITAAPQHRRIALERSGGGPLAGAGYRFADGLRRPAKGVNDARGFMFVSHRGEVMPSGFLPLSAGRVTSGSAVDLYRDSPLFRALRNPERLRGKCGACEYREVCGGSRARAYAVSGDSLGPDPSCPYQPGQAGGTASPLAASNSSAKASGGGPPGTP
ncbi:MAG: TIGR04053 family radical SAM/SPASM domain-containing protein [Solirubrobacterales bacterium]